MRTIKTYFKRAPFYNAFHRTWPYQLLSPRLSFFPSAKQVTIVKGITVPASVTAHKDQSQDKAFEESVPSMTVHFEATTPGGTGERGTKASTSSTCLLRLNRTSTR